MASKTSHNRIKMELSYLEAQFMRLLQRHELPNPFREYKFHPVRKWRFDFAWPKLKVAVEIDGNTFADHATVGNHAVGKTYQNDCKKSNAAQLEGWAILRADREMVDTDEFGQIVKSMLLRRIEQWKKGQHS